MDPDDATDRPAGAVVRLHPEDPGRSVLNAEASEIVGSSLGMDAERVREVVARYRSVAASLETEPEWRLVVTMNGVDGHHTVSTAEGTRIERHDSASTERGGRPSIRTSYVLKGVPFEFFSEARAFEFRFSEAVRTKDERLIAAVMAIVDAHAT